MSRLEQSEWKLLELIAEFVGRVKVPEENSFEDVWKVTNQICDRYGVGLAKVIEFPASPEMPMAASPEMAMAA
jgi:hypothetical protein